MKVFEILELLVRHGLRPPADVTQDWKSAARSVGVLGGPVNQVPARQSLLAKSAGLGTEYSHD